MKNELKDGLPSNADKFGSPFAMAFAIGFLLLGLLVFGVCGVWSFRLRKGMRINTAAQTLRNINSAQAVYESGIGNGNYTSNLALLGGGTASTEVGLLDSTVVNAQTTPKSGYLLGPIVTVAKTPKSPARYSMTAFPASAKGISRTGDDCYFIDETGVIRHSGRPDVPATATSEPIRE